MKHDIVIQPHIIIPAHELEITTSRSGGPGGQHVNKTDSRVTVRWNLMTTSALTEEQKQRVQAKLQHMLTKDGDILISSSASRSQQANKKAAFDVLSHKIRQALHVARTRKPTKKSQGAQESRLRTKKYRGTLKAMRRTRHHHDDSE